MEHPERNAPSFLRGHNLQKNPPILYTDNSSVVINNLLFEKIITSDLTAGISYHYTHVLRRLEDTITQDKMRDSK